ncbi:hypothetical protein CXG81DRAFT_27264 [Caulochytrium protostelioides]|uniref:Nucleotide exchange factor SIL1 n=1 Tax=Caulochytrium protostelioides TaxID=1555241 RepID=A0A4P9WZM9_9FUNG|nr:hypothetical protein CAUPRSCDRAFT_10540 [Caulochytrium protostelioides]RKP00019.1 hypothetical protein CXG81DRAFT_27264 [Caulochytrium protostelioides]|eukprot:RKP00019.1 hypothetical protein CXG81DRAFT_27264 [Caulochytrium protostelioides]
MLPQYVVPSMMQYSKIPGAEVDLARPLPPPSRVSRRLRIAFVALALGALLFVAIHRRPADVGVGVSDHLDATITDQHAEWVSSATVTHEHEGHGHVVIKDKDTLCFHEFEEPQHIDHAECYPKIFRATHVFQPIRQGQMIPPGLHVRMNMQTGAQEAKLLSEESDSNMQVVLVPKPASASASAAGQNASLPPINMGADASRLSAKERLTAQETDAFNQVIDRIVAEGASATDVLEQLTFLENVLHQSDFGRDFMRNSRGVEALQRTLTMDDAACRGMALLVVGACSSNNPSAQLAALDGGMIRSVLDVLTKETDPEVVRHAVYALSTLIRDFPHGVQQYEDAGGRHVLNSVLKRYRSDKRIVHKIEDLRSDISYLIV